MDDRNEPVLIEAMQELNTPKYLENGAERCNWADTVPAKLKKHPGPQAADAVPAKLRMYRIRKCGQVLQQLVSAAHVSMEPHAGLPCHGHMWCCARFSDSVGSRSEPQLAYLSVSA
jgi:hypothetical protein